MHVWLECADEVILMMCLLPLAFSNLKAGIRRTISATDASIKGCGAAEASGFVSKLDKASCALLGDVQARIAEEQLAPELLRCIVCNGSLGGGVICMPA